MEPNSPSKLHRSSSLPSRVPHLPAITPEPPSSSITRPYRLSPSTSRGLFPSSFKPSALLQRRSKANQGLSPVDAPAAEGPDSSSPAEQPLPPSSDSRPPTAYEILHVLPSATQQEIKTSFWRLARQHHPDKAPLEQREASSLLFLQIHSAYNTLKDPQARARYNLELSFQSSPGLTTDLRTPSAHFCSPSPRIFAPHGEPFTPRTTVNAYTPRGQLFTPRGTNAAAATFTPRTPYSGRNWETDQCW
ncbi:hypothetical protein L7F22_053124 [Adiantum nelumboides]|nr:hypothetical protein [Adiantum nelumboides]